MGISVSRLSALLLATSLLFCNCATIVSKTSYPVSIDSDPAGAHISITDKKGKEIYKGVTPTAIRLNSGAGFFSRAEYQVRFFANGYDEKVIPVSFKLNGWYFGNIAFGGVLGMLVIDPASGAMWRIEKSSQDIFATLGKSTISLKEPTLKIISINDVPEKMKSNLIKVN